MKQNIKKLATKGLMWAGISQSSTQIFRFAVTILLARLLLPQDFGLVGMATIFIGLISMVNELGFSAAIIQRKEITEKHLSTAFWVSIFFGVFLCIMTIVVSPYVADFFNEKRIQDLLISLSVVFIIGSFAVVHGSILAKRMDFKKVAAAEIGSEVSSGLIAVILAFAGFGVWSLVWRMIIGNLMIVVILWKINPWRPSLVFDKQSFKELFNFGGNVMGSNILSYAGGNIDYLTIGKVLGSVPLGYYTLAYQMTTFPASRISSVVNRVTFPAFSILQEDDAMLRKGFTNVVKYISLVTFPLISGLYAVSYALIPLVIGARWMPMILPLQILCIAGAVLSIGSPVSSILRCKGRADLEFKWNIMSLIILSLTIFVGVNYGISGVAFAVSATLLCLGWLLQWMANKLIGLSFIEYFKALYPATISSIMMLAAIETFQKFQPNTAPLITLLIGSIIIGMITYAIIIRTFFYSSVKEFKTILAGALGKK